ncbi:hypothetical protein [Bradyrhizobium sp. USDA 3650]
MQVFSAWITAAIVAASAPRPTRTATPLISSSMMLLFSAPSSAFAEAPALPR